MRYLIHYQNLSLEIGQTFLLAPLPLHLSLLRVIFGTIIVLFKDMFWPARWATVDKAWKQ